ncbi:hypothetical protein [Bosea sp. (in: a-proteobacteria)]|uniref:hypothetical protein n=1 Tax=Bosea sp. (in: a-proteobacteria) TaxID=1871050 RepID=UPI003341AA89
MRAGLERLRPWLALAGAACRSAAQRLARIDIVPALISAADHGERQARALWRSLRRLVPQRGLGLPGALLWRGLAALTGLGMTAALVTGLSAKDEAPPQFASLAAAAVSEAAASQTAARFAARPASLGAADWSPISRPIALFDLAAPELGRAAPAYEARRAPDGRREDIMTFATFAEKGSHLALRLRTGPSAGRGARPFTIDLVRAAAQRALSVTRSSAPVAIATRFGTVETADVVLDDGGRNRNCIAFRSAEETAAFAMSGWWCAGDRPSDRRQLACLIDRLDLVNAADDEALRRAFARSELARDPACARQHLATTGRKASWLDGDGAVPTLRMKTATAEAAKAAPPARPARTKAARRKR